MFRAAGLKPNLIRIVLMKDAAINSFVRCGNRMFIQSGPVEDADSALTLRPIRNISNVIEKANRSGEEE